MGTLMRMNPKPTKPKVSRIAKVSGLAIKNKLFTLTCEPNWISVSKRLPKPYKEILLCNVEDKWRVAGIFDPLDKQFYNQFECAPHDCPCFPTHWMPFPPIPKTKPKKEK